MKPHDGAPLAPVHREHAQQVFDIEIEALRCTRDALGEAFGKAVTLLLETIARPAKIVVTGVGKNLPIAEKISATLASTGSTSVVLNPVQALHGDLGILAAGDVLLALSFSGTSDEILALMPAVRRLGVPVIAMTGAPDSPLASCSEIVLPVKIDREACRQPARPPRWRWATPSPWSCSRRAVSSARTTPVSTRPGPSGARC